MGAQVAYASEPPGIAVLERLAWLGSYYVVRNSNYFLIPLRLDPDKHLERVEAENLPEDWDAFPPSETRPETSALTGSTRSAHRFSGSRVPLFHLPRTS